jgi:hypothetical protein
MISSFLKSSNVSSGVERTAESENTNAHRTHHGVRFMLLPLVTLPILTDSIALSRIEHVVAKAAVATGLRPVEESVH